MKRKKKRNLVKKIDSWEDLKREVMKEDLKKLFFLLLFAGIIYAVYKIFKLIL